MTQESPSRTLHRLDEGDLLLRAARLSAELGGPAQPDPAGLADVERELRIELALRERLGVERRLALAGPVLLEPGMRLAAQGIAGVAQIILRQFRAAAVEQEGRDGLSRLSRAAERDRVEVNALEMRGRLMLLGIADGAERMLRFERDLTQRAAGESRRQGQQQ